MKYKVKLQMHNDDATGDWGLCPANAIDIQTPFNSFWTHQGIFHDVFEHYFENIHPNFMGDAAFNIGGEIAAMGHLSYYWSNYYLYSRTLNKSSRYTFEHSIMYSTLSDMQEAIQYGYINYGSELICTIGKKRAGDSTLEDIISEHWSCLKDIKPNVNADELEYALKFKKSISMTKIRRLYRWGYWQAQKIAPHSYENRETLQSFLEFWEKLINNNTAEEISHHFRYLEFTITTGIRLKWDAEWITHEGTRIKVKNCYPIDDIYELENNYI